MEGKCDFLSFASISLLDFLHLISLNSGKTAMSATVGIGSDFPYVKIVSGFLISTFKHLVKTIIFLPSYSFLDVSNLYLPMGRFQLKQ